jgi:glycosyltransferase involved in cell wall biosynthesis
MTGPLVVQMVSSLGIGGAERAAVELAAGLRERDFRTEVWVVESPRVAPEQPLAEELRVRRIPVRRVPFSSIRSRGDRARFLAQWRGAGVSLINAHNRPCDWQVTLLARGAGIPAVYTRQLGYNDETRRQKLAYFAAARAASAVVALTRAVADHMVRVERAPRRKVHVIPDGIDTERYRPPTAAERRQKRRELGLAEGTFVWLTAARLASQKGFPFLLDAVARLPNRRPRVLLLAGDGPERERLRAQAVALGLDGCVRFLGPREDVHQLLWAADGYACTSLGEGQGLSLLEALAAGRPLVAPRLGCILEFGHDGLHFFGPAIEGWAESHDPADIARSLGAVEVSSGGSAAFGARRFVERNYSIRCMLDGYEALYRRILRGR